MSDAAIIIEGLSKTYERGKIRRGDIRSSLSSWWSGLGREKETFLALKDIHMTIRKGDVVGIVGPNGAGKSTLLKLLSRITFPTMGRMTIHGSLSSMLEVGTGFHPELTGRENIFLNGAILGMRREEVQRKLDSIVAFSGIEDFLNTPVKHYSSGMYVRLAFSVASHLEPDILIIDEVLAVGDQEFRKKCMEKLLDVSRQGRTIIMVSHQMAYLKDLCHTGYYLHAGTIRYHGPIEETINQYVHHYSQAKQIAVHAREDRRGSGQVRLTRFEMLNSTGKLLPVISSGEGVIFRLELKTFVASTFNIAVQLEFLNIYGQPEFVASNIIGDHSITNIKDMHILECFFPKFPLNTGMYFINVIISTSDQLADELLNVMHFEVEPGMYYVSGRLPPPAKGFLVEYTWRDLA